MKVLVLSIMIIFYIAGMLATEYWMMIDPPNGGYYAKFVP